MLVQEHAQTARKFLAAADTEFAVGDLLQGSEKMWGAACYAIMAVAQSRGWQFGSHVKLREAVLRLSDESGDDTLRGGFGVAEKFHANFYHDFMEHDSDFDFSREVVREFVDRTLSLMPGDPNGHR